MNNFVITDVKARQIFDSRGNPTVEADVILNGQFLGRASVPSGASTGSREALELRDGGTNYGGKGVSKAVWNINSEIKNTLLEKSFDQAKLDETLIDLDGAIDKSNLGANAILAVSLAAAKATALAQQKPFYQYLSELADAPEMMSLPMPMMNVVNGGAHANFVTDIQEYMIIPSGADTIFGALKIGTEVFHALKKVLDARGYATTVGDEGGYAPKMKNGDEEPLECIAEAVKKAGYKFGSDIKIALDVAASEFMERKGKTAEEMISVYKELCGKYPIVSIEDGLSENDWGNWEVMTKELGGKIQLVGDDLFVTNTKLLKRGIEEKVGNAILIKPNQIGTLSETINAVKMAKESNYRTIISHRSGETEDTSIAHIAVGLNAGQIKTGSLSRTDRMCKYNELLRIAEENPKLKLANPFKQ